MQKDKTPQLSQLLDFSDESVVLREVEKTFRYGYHASGFRAISHVYALICRLFAGKYPGYRKCNTEYHDLTHTLEVLVATARLADGHNLQGDPLPLEMATNLYLAALLHDTGYIQQEDDTEGTGAKHTRNHEERSVSFTMKNASHLHIPPGDVEVVSRLITGTDLNNGFPQAAFHDEGERKAGILLATADLLGQMADRAYLEKLIFLYRELREAGIGDYKTEFDILRTTLGFYKIIRERLDGPLMGAYREVQMHFKLRFGVDRNLYMEAIERQMQYLEGIIADDTANFRKKLKRMDLEALQPGKSERSA